MRHTFNYNPNSPARFASHHRALLQAMINLSIHGDGGDIQLPKSLIPLLHGDNERGWWSIDDLIVGHDENRGKFRLYGLNQPRLSINRRSGAITIDGMIKFNGRCDADEGQRRF